MKLFKNAYARFFLFSILLVAMGYLATNGNITGSVIQGTPHEQGDVSVYFCQVDDCAGAIITAINEASDVKCAFYDLNSKPLEEALTARKAKVLVFEKNYEGYGTSVPAAHGGLMHDKFCVLDAGTPNERVITGSTNPTVNGFTKNDNNILLIAGSVIAENYLDEWGELAGKKERRVAHPLINHTDTNTSFLIENYFCPEDACEEHVLEELGKARRSIDFITFSFTADSIGNLLVQKATEGVTVSGVFEKRQKSKYSEYQKLLNAGLDVKFDNNPYTMHHKVFIIDADDPARATVITGSYNPTKNGNTRNDENILIIHNQKLSEAFFTEFSRVWNLP